MASTAEKPISRLYQRLRAVGVDTPYLRNTALPSWWNESVADSPSGFQETLMLIARHLGLSLRSLQDEASPVELRDFGPCNFKKSSGVTEGDLAVTRAICTRAVQIAAASIQSPWQQVIPSSGSEIRESILGSGAPWVGLANLVDWCWSKGIPVLHVSHFPKSAKKMDGMAAIVDGRPVIILCKNHKQEAWLLFILAHELGHIVKGHVSQNGVLVDEHIAKDTSDVDIQESEANATATELLTGTADCRFVKTGRWPNAQQLAEIAIRYGKQNQVDPGHVILNYSNNIGGSFHALGNAALALINPHPDSSKVIYERMASHLDWSGIPEDSSEFLMRVTSPNRSK